MQALKKFLKRNAPVFIFGLIIGLVFLLIILTQPKDENRTPSGFTRVEEEIFDREPKEPEPTEKPTEYAPQIASPENKGKPYFYGEYDPNLRDEMGYPVPPKIGTTSIAPKADEEHKMEIDRIERENYNIRTKTIYVDFTETGFSPPDIIAFTGQRIIWTNRTSAEIIIVQPVQIHEALKGGISLKPGESFEFRPLVDKQFTYAEKNSAKYGTILVNDVTRPLMNLKYSQ